jgi:hypothetical protein
MVLYPAVCIAVSKPEANCRGINILSNAALLAAWLKTTTLLELQQAVVHAESISVPAEQ